MRRCNKKTARHARAALSRIRGISRTNDDKCRKSWQFLKQHLATLRVDGKVPDVLQLRCAGMFHCAKLFRYTSQLRPYPGRLPPPGRFSTVLSPSLLTAVGWAKATTAEPEITTPRKLCSFGARQPGGPWQKNGLYRFRADGYRPPEALWALP